MYQEIFTQKIKKARQEAGYTQIQVADLTGILPSKIAKIETGAQNADIETIGILAEFYNVSIDWLFGLGRKEKDQKNLQ